MAKPEITIASQYIFACFDMRILLYRVRPEVPDFAGQ